MKRVGKTFVESLNNRADPTELIEAFDFPETNSRVLMTESSMNMACGDPNLIS